MTPEQAQDIKQQLAAVSADALGLVAGRDEAALTRRPAAGGWSAAECLQHLILTADAMLPLAEAGLQTLVREGRKSSRPAGLGILGWLLARSLEPPPRMKSKTIAPFEPVAFTEPLTLAERFAATNERFGAFIDRAIGYDTGSVKVASPFNASIRYNVHAALRIVLAHARRHLFQAREALGRA